MGGLSCSEIKPTFVPEFKFLFQSLLSQNTFFKLGLTNLLNKGLHVARSLCDPIQGAVTVSVLNIREKPVIIERETVVGRQRV